MAMEREFEIDLDEIKEFELEDDEQELEDEVSKMMKVWDRTQILREIHEEQLRAARDEKAIEDVYDGETDFEDIIKTMNPVDEREAVFIKILEPFPNGRNIKTTNTILFDCLGYLEGEPQPYESTLHDGKPRKLNLAEGPILPGLLLAMLELREGERANIMIRSEMAFGPLGTYNSDVVIPPEATILYHVKILKVWDESQLDEVLEYDRINYLNLSVEEKIPLIEEHKEVANNYLRDGQIRDALMRYKAGIELLEEVPDYKLFTSERTRMLKVTLLQNAAIAYNKLAMHKSASKMAKKALFIEPNSKKAYYQLIKARIALEDYVRAERFLTEAEVIFPNNQEFNQLKLELDRSFRKGREERDELLKKMVGVSKSK